MSWRIRLIILFICGVFYGSWAKNSAFSMNNRSYRNSSKMIPLIFLGITAAGFAVYWLSKKKGSGALHGWYYKLKGEIFDKIEDMRDLTREGYERIIDESARQYSGLKNVDREQLRDAVREMKSRWDVIRGQMRQGREEYGRDGSGRRGGSRDMEEDRRGSERVE